MEIVAAQSILQIFTVFYMICSSLIFKRQHFVNTVNETLTVIRIQAYPKVFFFKN